MRIIHFLGIFILLFVLFTGGLYMYSHKTPNKTVTVAPSQETVPEIKWGGTFYPALDWDAKDIDAQMDILKKNNISTIRIDYVPLSSPDHDLSDFIVQSAKKYHINVVLILQPEHIDYTNSELDYSKIGTDIAQEAIQRFGSYVDYYQLANEVGGTVYKSGDGQTIDSYDLIKYGRLKDTIIAMQATIKSQDPKAKTIITNQWLHYGILDMLIKDNVSFDIIGWNWFPAGIDMDHIEYAPGKSINLLEKLKSYHKEVWLTEFNRDHGSEGANGDQLQASFLQEKLQKYYDSGVFSAMFIHQLFDTPSAQEKDHHWGLISVDPKTHTFTPKPALKVFSDFIIAHS